MKAEEIWSMRRKTIIPVLAVLLAVLALLFACNADKKTDAAVMQMQQEELVTAVFTDLGRSLIAELQPFDKTKLYWKYAARKSLAADGQSMLDGSGLRSGETVSYNEAGAEFVKEDRSEGLDNVPGFSQGLWDFMLFGYVRSGEEGSYTYSLVYSGETKTVQLKKDGANSVSITVSPVSDHGPGTIKVDFANILFDPIQEETEGIAELTKSATYKPITAEESAAVPSDGIVEAIPGLYMVQVVFTFKIDEVTYTYAEGSVVVTVYSNQQTRVYGSLDELATSAEIVVTGATYPNPTGMLTKEWKEESGQWRITFADTNPASEATTFAWYVDDELQSEDTNEFTYTPRTESVNITCVFGNTSGTGSASVYIK